MKSSKQRRQEIKEKRRMKAEKLKNIDLFNNPNKFPLYAVVADHMELNHNNMYGLLPLFYVDKPFICCDCGSEELRTEKQQKW